MRVIPDHVAISPCPNDTYVWAGILLGAVKLRGETTRVLLEDIESLNDGLAEGRHAVAKGSYALAVALHRTHDVLAAGSAMGHGVGPVVLAPGPARSVEEALSRSPGLEVLVPGDRTTAALLFRAFHAGAARIRAVPYSEIMPMLSRREAGLGVCIHEGRFTYRDHGLHLVEDLGSVYEAKTRSPLPLGGVIVDRRVDAAWTRDLAAALRGSISWADEHPDEVWPLMRAHARELEDHAIHAHVDLYVNAWTYDLGPSGKDALDRFATLVRDGGASVGAPRIVGS